ncbi:MAG: twin-arginine translocase subunit TatC [Nitrospirae bacterium CG_4_10_14_0_8_um_filter_41_23]|nr:twin-arginine translocase subunit TatC [Nitrospirota bacterium]OIP60500.1 MAG: twin arginine-targeting protein translocase TatC [Nitrospirae bacterium CG2_30_41_42]PIQ94528.1 MAG: twin-arginine translocase subunit TatC [Nitrospirae bacterium CG11_big_fil_rev_8_21_14_0_20_41_14]PIV42919.1 MAG: twin-arginine translocase subunit TatC [Nitrospirae bacterium CG02_land_8_20_14_3_00_41_53]PIW87800.1 MAG: twin-arginine translocase subunit TatC [Nitrospirae bacterium CG_4_8_14_3_um_filter_41_47]PIY8
MEEHKMPLTEHLGDLRKRIIVSFAALFITFLISFNYSEDIFRFIMFPLKYNLDFSLKNMYIHFVPQDKLQNTKLVFLAPAEAFWMNIKVAFVAGLILALPVIFYQLWKFISPGLLHKEKRYVVPFILLATSLFLIGAAFCFFIVLPFAMGFLLTYKVGDFLSPMLSVGNYVDFCLKFILAFGAVFELPIAIIFFTRMGIVTPKTLAKNRKYAILLAFVVAAILTPTPDAFNQTLMAVPIIVLYEVGIILSRIFKRRKLE